MGEPSGTGAADDADAVLDGLVRLGVELPFNRHLGVEVREVTVGRCVTALPGNPALTNHLGGVHAIAELAPVELAAAVAASSRLSPLVVRGYVPVVGALRTRFRAPARGDLLAAAEVDERAGAVALEMADAGERPRLTVEVEVTDRDGTLVNRSQVDLVYLRPETDVG